MNALALLEFESIARGVLAVDRLLKRAPIALLRCGTIHPGRYLVLCGGSVASTDEAYRAASEIGAPCDTVLLADPHSDLRAALGGETMPLPAGGDLLVLEATSSPRLVRLLDTILKAVPVRLSSLYLADDLGGHAYAMLGGELADLESAHAMAAGETQATIVSRPDPELLASLAAATQFGRCPLRELPAGEFVPGGGEEA